MYICNTYIYIYMGYTHIYIYMLYTHIYIYVYRFNYIKLLKSKVVTHQCPPNHGGKVFKKNHPLHQVLGGHPLHMMGLVGESPFAHIL